MEQTATITAQEKREATSRATPAYDRGTIGGVYLITNTGLDMLIGKDRDTVREKIEQDKEHSPLDYRFFDDGKRAWAYWAVRDVGGEIKPFTFPNLAQYSLTSPQLYTKAVTYPHILAHAVGLLKQKPTTLWEKMMKPTTIILAIVAVVFVMGLMLMALQG